MSEPRLERCVFRAGMPPATTLVVQPPAGVVPRGISSSDGLTGAFPSWAPTLRAPCSRGAESSAPG